ncbi:MAG: phosphoglucosamine mutase [Leptolyngbya sp. SIO3F4]|nr:phosphoglucosamine mutase [Leptolyngbya sp. SIO3F4]
MVTSHARPQQAKFSGWQSLELPVTPLFGTDGIRSRAGELLSAPFALQIGFWAGQIIRQQKSGAIVLGQDSRNSSPMIAAALAAGLTSVGLEVWDMGLCPTAAVAYMAAADEVAGGIMISASHNPPADNGIKFFGANGTKLEKSLQFKIEQALRQGNCVGAFNPGNQWGRTYQRPELVERYIDSLHQPFPMQGYLSGLRIVLDLAWGAAARVAHSVFESTGAEVIVIHGCADGNRINVNCGSTHLASLQAAVSEHNADIGFAFDGDADRVMAVDSQGRVVNGDYILYFWGQTLMQQYQLPDDIIISTVMANLGFERAWERLGGQLIRTQVGDQHVHAEMVARGAMLGGEQSGHILCHHYSLTGDGILTALHLAAWLKQAGCCLPELIDQSFEPYPQRLKNVRVESREKRRHWKSCEPLQQAITKAELAMGDQGRVLVRASGTEPVIRVMVEAANAELVEHWTDALADVVSMSLAV